ALRSAAASIDSRLRAKRLVFRATMHPEFLAATHFPRPLVDATGIEVVGSAPARSRRATVVPGEQQPEDAPARLLYMAATDAALDRLESVLQGPQNTSTDAWQDVRKFAELRLAQVNEILRTHAEDDSGSVHG